jgi:hypothetical protein
LTIQNSSAIINMMHSFNSENTPFPTFSGVEAYDFKRLYSHLQHADLLASFRTLFTATMKNADMQHVAVTYTSPLPAGTTYHARKEKWEATFSPDPVGNLLLSPSRKPIHSFDLDAICRLLDLVISNNFISFAGTTVRQTCGIPMGIAPGGDIATYFLALHEYQFITQEPIGEAPYIWQHTERDLWITIVKNAFTAASPSAYHTNGWKLRSTLQPRPSPHTFPSPPKRRRHATAPDIARPLPSLAAALLTLPSLLLENNQPATTAARSAGIKPLQQRIEEDIFYKMLSYQAGAERHKFLCTQFAQAKKTVMAAFTAGLTETQRTAENILSFFRHTRRYIDDLISLNNSHFSKLLYSSQHHAGLHGIYPGIPGADHGLQVSLQNTDPRRTDYMDLSLTIHDSLGTARFASSLFDKLEAPGFSDVFIPRFIPPASNVDDSSKNALLPSQISRFAIANSTPQAFAQSVAQCIIRLQLRGYLRLRLLSKFKRSLAAKPFLFAADPITRQDIFNLTVKSLEPALRSALARDARTIGLS